MKKNKLNFIIFFIFILTQNFSAAQTVGSVNKVKVGYYEQEIFQEGAGPDLIKKGYAYEYYRKLSEYTGLEFEYVYGNFVSLYEQLLEGEIDLLAGLAYTDARAEKINDENLPMGSTYYYLLKKIENHEITRELESLNGKKICVLNSIMVKLINEWINEHSINTQVIVCDTAEEMYSLFDKGETDLIMVEGSGTSERNDAEVFLTVGNTDYYLCVAKQRHDILSRVNSFHKALDSEEPGYLTNLFNKYYPRTISGNTFSAEELEYVKSLGKIKIGYLNNYLPFCDTDSKGTVTGLIKDIFPMQMQRIDAADLELEYKAYDTFSQLISDLQNEKIDAAFPVGGGLYFSEKNGFHQSDPVIKTSMALIYKDEFRIEKTPVFAVNRNNDMQLYFIITNFPDAQIIYLDSIEECLEAIKKGQATFTCVNGIRVTSLLKISTFKNLNYRFMFQGDERCYGVKNGNEKLLHILNRGIYNIGDQYALNQAYKYTEMLHKYTASDYFKFFLYIFIPVIFFTGLVTVIYNINTKKKLSILNAELKSALENKEKYIADMIRYASSETDADMILTQLVDYIGNNNKPDRVYVFEENENHTFDNTYEWCNEGITKEKDNLQDVPYKGILDVWFNEFNKHGPVIIEDVENYKNVSQVIYDILKPQNIQSLVAIPIAVQGRNIGFIGVDNPPANTAKDVTDFLQQIEFLFSLMIRIRNASKSLENIALHDQLTGFYNRRAYEEAVNEYRKNGIMGPFVYVSIDINGLKIINDTIGHEAGDELISGASKCIRQLFEPFGKIYRIGGDEFIALLKVDTNKLETIKDKFQKTCDAWHGKLVNTLSVSCGYVCTEEYPELALHEIAILADKKMYEAKSQYYKKSGVDRRGQQDAHKALCNLYTKIIRINLTEDSFQIINTDINFLRSHFASNKTSLNIFYRRKIGSNFKHVMMELIRTDDYSDNNQSLYLYVKKIEL